MTRRRVVFLLMGVALCMARPLAAVAQDRTASSFDAPVPRSLPRVAGPALSGRGATREASHEIPTGAPPCTLSPETSHASLSLTKDGSGNPILSWSGTGPYTVTRSTSPGFTYQVGTLAQSTSATSFTDSGTSGSALVYYYDIADEGVGEISEAVWGLGYVPPIPPTVTSVSPLGAWVGDPVTITGENFDPIALENQVMWNQIPAAVDPLATNTTTTLHVTIPKGATQASVSACAYQACSPVDTSNPNAVVEVATTPFTDIGTMAFDDAAVTGGHQLRVADRGTSAIYSVDPEVKGATAITTLHEQRRLAAHDPHVLPERRQRALYKRSRWDAQRYDLQFEPGGRNAHDLRDNPRRTDQHLPRHQPRNRSDAPRSRGQSPVVRVCLHRRRGQRLYPPHPARDDALHDRNHRH